MAAASLKGGEDLRQKK